jgi:hypothetical protein
MISGLSTRSFEQLIQAIAAKVIGPGTIIFGDGRDGGREATFEGPISYKRQAGTWDGYGVVQAKFKQRPQNTQADAEWALQQLRSELEDFSDPKKARKKPDYYIFATNVVLTPFLGKGSKDKAYHLLKGQRLYWDRGRLARRERVARAKGSTRMNKTRAC